MTCWIAHCTGEDRACTLYRSRSRGAQAKIARCTGEDRARCADNIISHVLLLLHNKMNVTHTNGQQQLQLQRKQQQQQ